MSPEPYVRGQALALALLLVAAAVLGSPIGALSCSLAGGVAAWVLQARYRGDLAAAGVDAPPFDPKRSTERSRVPPHRERLDRIVAGDARAAFAVGVAASALMVGFRVSPVRTGLAPATPVLVAGAALAVFLSSLVDWYLILPRVSGLLGIRPCRSPYGECARFPRTWRETTRWWYIHRIVAALVLRFGLSFAIAVTIKNEITLSLTSGAVVGGFASYMATIPKAVMQAGHPTMIVGQTLRRRDTKRVWSTVKLRGRRVRLPWRTLHVSGSVGKREYVYDVAVEGVQLVLAAEHEGPVRRDDHGAVVYEQHPRKVKLSEVDPSEPEKAKKQFSGCAGRCSGINWYCIENPNCFATK